MCNVQMHEKDKENSQIMFFTWQTQQGSDSRWEPGSTEYFFGFKSFIMVSSLNPVLTFPMRSSRANNSYLDS